MLLLTKPASHSDGASLQDRLFQSCRKPVRAKTEPGPPGHRPALLVFRSGEVSRSSQQQPRCAAFPSRTFPEGLLAASPVGAPWPQQSQSPHRDLLNPQECRSLLEKAAQHLE